jgi:hypothetical protein
LIAAYFSVALIGGWFLRSQPAITTALARLPVAYLLLANSLFVFFGIPLSAVGDLLLLKRIGFDYLLFWPLVVGTASCFQIFFFRSSLCSSSTPALVTRLGAESRRILLPRRSRNATLVLLIRSVPVMPFMLGSFVISLMPGVPAKSIVCLSVLGSYLYYAYFGAGFFLGATAFKS